MGKVVLLTVCFLFAIVGALSAKTAPYSYKQKYGLVLETDGLGETQRVWPVNKPANTKGSYGIYMSIEVFRVIWLPYKNARIKCWLVYGMGGDAANIEVLTLDKRGNVKPILSDFCDSGLFGRWSCGQFIVTHTNRDDGFIISYTRIQWNQKTGKFERGESYQATDILDKMSLYSTFNLVRIIATLKNGRWSQDNAKTYILTWFTPTGYIKKRLPRLFRDMPCVQAKCTEASQNKKDKNVYFSRCNPKDEIRSDWVYRYGD